jgi:CheY-like chemotaxis protein
MTLRSVGRTLWTGVRALVGAGTGDRPAEPGGAPDPAPDTTAGLSAEAAPLPSPSSPDLSGLSVLVVEDQPLNQRVVELILGPLGVELTMTENGRQAVDAVEARRFDLMLIDLQIPVLDGLEVTRMIRAREVELGRPRTPIVALTANSMPQHVTQAREAGMDGLLPKPVRPQVLIDLLAEVTAGGRKSQS